MKLSIHDFVTVTLHVKGIEILKQNGKINLMEPGSNKLTLKICELLEIFGGEKYNPCLPFFDEFIETDVGSGSYRVIIRKNSDCNMPEIATYIRKTNGWSLLEIKEKFLSGKPCIVAINKTELEANKIKEYLSALGAEATVTEYIE